jgi:dihydropteroate synthase
VRILSLASEADVRREMLRVGCDPEGVAIMAPNARSWVLCIENVSAPAANILKQEMLAAGGDAVTHRDTITARAPRGPVLAFGTRAVLYSVAKKLGAQPFGLPAVGVAMRRALQARGARGGELRLGGRVFPAGRTLVMGVLNVTPDSFSDGGRFTDPRAAVAHAEAMLRDGADLIDVGGASTRPGAAPVAEDEELRRVLPVLDALQSIGASLSIDTTSARVALAACRRGAVLVNDVTGLREGDVLAQIAAEHDAGVCVMHMRGTPATMQSDTRYDDLLGDVVRALAESAARAVGAGVPEESVVLDPGLGFGKSAAQNCVLVRRLGDVCALGHPVLVGASRKSFLGRYAAAPGAREPVPVDERESAGIALAALAATHGARIVRAHDVRATVHAVRVADAVLGAAESDA